MIDLTPLEVRQKKGDFRRAFRGYDAELVNDFLDLVADRMEELVRENLSLRDAVESVQAEVGEYREKEKALSEALMTAQKLREDARENVEKETELMVREARLKAEAVRDDVARQLVREEETLRALRARRAQLVESFRRLLDREMSELDIIEETLELGQSPDARASAPPPPSPAVEGTELWAQPQVKAQPQEKPGPQEKPEDKAGQKSGQKLELTPEDEPAEKPAEKPRSPAAAPGTDAAGEPGKATAPDGDEDDLLDEQDWLSSLIEE